MKRMLVIAALAALVLLGMSSSAIAADVSGTWKLAAPQGGGGGGGRAPAERTLMLKQDGDKLTGKLVVKFGENTRESNIEDGKVTGDSIEFKVKMQGRDGQEMVTTYKAKVTDDKMEGTSQMGERERPFTATKEK